MTGVTIGETEENLPSLFVNLQVANNMRNHYVRQSIGSARAIVNAIRQLSDTSDLPMV